MVIYEFKYCCSTCESAYVTKSLHRTKLGAYKAMKKHKSDKFKKWYDERSLYGKESSSYPYDFDQGWDITEKILQD